MGGLNQVSVAGRIVHLADDPDLGLVGVLLADEDLIPFCNRTAYPLEVGRAFVLNGSLRGRRELVSGVPKVRSYLEVTHVFPVHEPDVSDRETAESALVEAPESPVPSTDHSAPHEGDPSPEPKPAESPVCTTFRGPAPPWP